MWKSAVCLLRIISQMMQLRKPHKEKGFSPKCLTGCKVQRGRAIWPQRPLSSAALISVILPAETSALLKGLGGKINFRFLPMEHSPEKALVREPSVVFSPCFSRPVAVGHFLWLVGSPRFHENVSTQIKNLLRGIHPGHWLQRDWRSTPFYFSSLGSSLNSATRRSWIGV